MHHKNSFVCGLTSEKVIGCVYKRVVELREGVHALSNAFTCFTRTCNLLDKLLSEKLVFKHALQTRKGFLVRIC